MKIKENNYPPEIKGYNMCSINNTHLRKTAEETGAMQDSQLPLNGQE
jgi:hypothetical protein